MTQSSTPSVDTKKRQPLQAIRGMNDVLPTHSLLWLEFEETVRDWLKAYGYQQMRTPILEQTALFLRGIGEVTDIVEKEMYTFTDALNGEQLTLRPEGTASAARAVIEHNLLYDGPKRVWYTGPMFRHERPQRGRYRQFHQVGVEAFGLTGPDVDAELIIMGQRLWQAFNIDHQIQLQINTLGSADERLAHRQALIVYFEQHVDQLDADAQRRLYSNPLRILDSKNPAMQGVIEAAPKLIDFVGEATLTHFATLQQLLKLAGVPFTINPRLVRGLDYYNLTVFEWVTDDLGAQGTVCGGGRYDGLLAQLGGKAAPACGFALGVERLLDLIQTQYKTEGRVLAHRCDVYVVHHAAGELATVALSQAFLAAEQLRDAGLSVVLHCGGGSLKSQMKKADQSGAFIAVILGEDELNQQQVTLKLMRHPLDEVLDDVAETQDDAHVSLVGQQQTVSFDQLFPVVLGLMGYQLGDESDDAANEQTSDESTKHTGEAA
jgi:histidyl-tRNA synthetase